MNTEKREPRNIDYFSQNQYGFDWGDMEVVRCISDEKFGVLLVIKTSKQEIEIRSTPSGLLRVGNVKKLK